MCNDTKKQKKIRALEIKRDKLMSHLKTLDWDNLEAVIDWLYEMQEPSNHFSVKVDNDTILKVFTDNNYQILCYTGKDFNKNDRRIFALWLIGQALYSLKEFGSIHQAMLRFTKEWKEKNWGYG